MASPQLDRARQALALARRVVVLTGAGVSAESGVPTFRGPDGLWRNHDVARLATPQAFRQDPALVWEFYNWRRELLSKCQPNPAHLALARLEGLKPDLALITQNVDGLHRRAGSNNLLEIHGNLWRLRCLGCGRETTDERVPVPYPPLCEGCGGLLRPAVVWFGEPLEPRVLKKAARLSQSSDLMLVIGTSALVYPAASLTPLAKQAGATVIEVNVEKTPHTAVTDIHLQGRAGEVVPSLVALAAAGS